MTENKPPTTTAESDRKTKGQRHINLLWEVTQSIIALSLTAAYIFVSISKIESIALNNSFFLVIGFYFGRTNHQKTGGTGSRIENDTR